MATAYNQKTGDKLRLNDFSLVWGGLFDINNNWSTDHKSHRFGQDADINLVPIPNRIGFQELINNEGFQLILHDNHWHLRM